MANYLLCLAIFKIALPILLVVSTIFRPSLLSAIYLLFFFYLPIVPVPTIRTMAGHTGIYLKILLGVSVIAAISQFAFQIVLLAMPPYANFLKDCEMLEKILRHAGFVRLNGISATAATTWLTPEIIMLVGSIVTYAACAKLTIEEPETPGEPTADISQTKSLKRLFGIAVSAGKYVALTSLCIAAILRPSVPGGLYFLVFLCAATWWGCNRHLQKGFAIVLRFVMAVVFLHICALYTYQTQWPQELLESNSTYSRYFGLTPLMIVHCDDPREYLWTRMEWASYLNPLALLWLYYILATESKLLLMPQLRRRKHVHLHLDPKLLQPIPYSHPKFTDNVIKIRLWSASERNSPKQPKTQKKQGAFSRLEGSINGPLNRQMSQRLSNRRLVRSSTTRHRWQSATRKVRVKKEKGKTSETTPLIKGVSPSRKYGSGGKRGAGILQDSTGSVTVSGEGHDDIPMEELGTTEEEEEKPTLLDNIIYGIESLVQLLIRTSYIATNIMMMAWSITFHSWITFVLLLWANVLWMIPNQRRAMLRCSPFLVLYAWFLLIAGYVFSMDLTDAELPQVIGNVDLAPIGFEKITDLPCKFLLVKCVFTSMFWITLRQYMKERQEARQNSTLADMVAPLQVTVGTAAGISRDEKKSNKTMEVIGQYAKGFLTKFWIWIVAITLFAVAITGQRMTGFRIIYMALFLIFVLSFQLSFRIWRKMMFGFWLTVILYSMLILVLVYTYQFKNIQEYWTVYLHVTKTQQLDIGLEDYGPKQLFIRLVTPTFFVIITVIQLHYFHKDFMDISDPKNTSGAEMPSEGSSAQGGVMEPSSEKTDLDTSIKFDLTDIGNMSTVQLQETFINWLKELRHIINLIYLFLEIHLPRIVLVIAMLLCIYDQCAIYLAVVLLIVLSCMIGRPVYLFAMYSTSILVSLMLLARMLYQIQYIEHNKWNVTCDDFPVTNSSDNATILNSAEWLGFRKVSEEISLPEMVKWNIMYILAVTLWSVVIVRQNNHRIAMGRPPKRPYFMFPRIKRADADKNLKSCMKYLLNYGFYKFGVEICLIVTVIAIGMRMDLYAVLYSAWLCILLAVKRKTLSKIWNLYFTFIAIILPIQYVMLIGLPPSLCTEFPWDTSEPLRRLQEWAFLLDFKYPLPAKKLLCDFVLLLLVSRQSLVFRIEKRNIGMDYPGGSNESIIHHAEEKGFVNPTPDFVTYCRSYLDVLKRSIFLSWLWITLAIVFIAGTTRVSLFSTGYLIGSFVFLWQGSDLYLRPVPKILRSWNWLLGFNTAVIFIKTVLQIAGCVYVEEIKQHACWFVQLMAIGCVKKFSNIARSAGIKEPEVCDVPREYIGLVWDGICFAFLLVQRRIFNSYNFFHMVNETKATTILASRGADLIEELRDKGMREQEEGERRILEKIKAKMDRIKANQQKFHGPAFKDPTNHFVDGIFPRSRPTYRKRIPKSYKEAIRSGDYYMFDDDDEEELDLIEESQPSGEDLEDERVTRDSIKKPTITELLTSALKTDIGTTVRSSDVDIRRRSSMPLSRQRSIMSGRSQMSVPLSAPPTIGMHPHSVTIIDPKDEIDGVDKEPQPGTSKDEEISELSEPKEDTRCQKILNLILFAWVFLESCMVSLTFFLNKYSREYRYVLRVLNKEKKILKEKTEYSVGLRLGTAQVWQPVGSYPTLLKESSEGTVEPTPSVGTVSPSDSYRIALTAGRKPEVVTSNDSSDEKPPISEEESDSKAQAASLPYSPEFDRRKASVLTVPEIRILAPSLERGLDSPFLGSHEGEPINLLEVYEDGEMSSVDQPPIIRLLLAMWYIVLSHSDIMCYFMIFLYQIKSATFLSLPLPLMVFCWGTLSIPRPSKTFWVTIIAYTEVVVLIKCMFQFEILPWNRSQNLSQFFPPRIIGIEKKPGYALWDLLLLLVVFFHRFLLKCLGLWKSTYVPAIVLADGEYNISNNELQEIGQDPTKLPSSMTASGSGALHPIKTINGRKGSDLQKLVEESEESELKDTQSTASDEVISIQTEQIHACAQFTTSFRMAISRYADSTKLFFKQLLDPTSRVATDVYSYMFLCDFFNFFVILMGYSSFGPQQGDEGVSSYLEDNRVPVLFLLMLIIQFALIIIDRAIFLRKYIFGKVVFQFIQIVLLHVWLFILYPLITERGFNSVLPPQMYYMVKCFYLLLSGYQIRCGYPTRILGNFICKGYNYVNMFLFKGFMAIPFLFELRTVMDWMWTDTSMTVFDWIKMEDIFAHIFQLKCSRYVENEFPQPRGEKKSPVVKYFMGGATLALMIAIIWFPLVFFSLGNAVGEFNVPYDVSIDLRIGPYQPIYTMSVQSNSIFSFNKNDMDRTLKAYDQNKVALTFISNYEAGDIAAIKFSRDSATVWTISPPDRTRMLDEVGSKNPLTVHFQYTVSHKSNTKEDSGIIRDEIRIVLPATISGKPNPARVKLLDMLNGTIKDVEGVPFNYLFPKFIKVTNKGTARPISQLMENFGAKGDTVVRNITINHEENPPSLEDPKKEWWEIKEVCSDNNYQKYLSRLPYADCLSIIMYTFNDKRFPATLNFITAGGIIGVYTTIVLVAGRLLRGFFAGMCFKIMFEDLPNVDRVLQLCFDIYLVREAGEFSLEEDLFAKLVFLFRSPETLIKWTRTKEELEDDEEDEEDGDDRPE